MRAITTIFTLLISLQLTMAFTERELEIIRNGDKDASFRVLLTTDAIDSFTLRMQSSDINADSIVTDEDLQLLLQRLLITMNESGGVGIAAPQVGVLKNIFLFIRIDNFSPHNYSFEMFHVEHFRTNPYYINERISSSERDG